MNSKRKTKQRFKVQFSYEGWEVLCDIFVKLQLYDKIQFVAVGWYPPPAYTYFEQPFCHVSGNIITQSTGLTSHQTSSIPDQTHEFIVSLTNKSNVFLTGQWPPGHYCLLASGACPAGFTRSQGHMRALKIYGPSAGYITQAKFGDSKIHCHGYCGQFGQWIGELYIAACCKWWSTQKSFVTRHKHPK